MTFLLVTNLFLLLVCAILTTALVLTSNERFYVKRISEKFGENEAKKYQVFFDKEKLKKALAELKLSGRQVNDLLEANYYCIIITYNTACLYYSFPKDSTLAAFPYERISAKKLFTLIEKASIEPPKSDSNILYFSKYRAGV